MTSLLTNVAARTALQTLTQTNMNMERTQSRISTGLRVGSAQDNAAYWSIATTMRSDNAALSTVQDALGLGSATVDVAYNAINNSIKVVDEIKSKLVAAREPGVDKSKIQSEIAELQNQLSSVAGASVFSGENWISVNSTGTAYNATKQIVASFSRTGGAVSIGTISVNTANVKLYDSNTAASGILDASRGANGALSTTGTFSVSSLNIASLTDSTADITTLDSYIAGADVAIASMTTAASTLGAVKSRIDLQKDFVSGLMNAIDRGIGQLVDADMNEESTRLQALQVQAQLGIQALSIANQSSQNILSLFR
ncbi:MAG: flagellin [Rhodomicrobiaceae bacterium]